MEIVVFFDLILEVIKYILAGYALFEKKIETRYGLGIMVTIGGMTLAWNVADSVETISILITPILFCGLFITAGLSVKDGVAYVCKLIFLILCIDYAIEKFVKMIASVDIRDESGWMISNLISIFVYSSICLIRRNGKFKDNPKIQVLQKIILYAGIVVMAVAMPLTISGLSFFAEGIESLGTIKGIQLLSAISMISMVVLVMFVIYINNTNKKIKQYLEVERALKETQKNYYEAMIQKEEDTKKFRHDVSNHIMCLRELAEREELGGIKQYIDEMQGEIGNIQKRCYSIGNTVMDAVLNYYLQMLPEGVVITVKGYVEENLPISDTELCTIFSNIIRNSLEELEKQPNTNKYLKIKAHAGKEDFTIEVYNSTQEKKEEGKGGLPETTKEDKSNHGIGLKNIKETVEKNKGIFRWESTAEEFRVKVILPLRLRG